MTNIIEMYQRKSKRRFNSTQSDEAEGGLFSKDNLLKRCGQLQIDIKGMHTDLLKANFGCTADELSDITSNTLLDIMVLDVAQLLISCTPVPKIADLVALKMIASESGGASHLADVIMASQSTEHGLAP
jgi:hypothetical protein